MYWEEWLLGHTTIRWYRVYLIIAGFSLSLLLLLTRGILVSFGFLLLFPRSALLEQLQVVSVRIVLDEYLEEKHPVTSDHKGGLRTFTHTYSCALDSVCLHLCIPPVIWIVRRFVCGWCGRGCGEVSSANGVRPQVLLQSSGLPPDK